MSPADTTLHLPGSQPLRISFGCHRGRLYVDLRYQYLHPETQRLMPGRRGVSFSAANLPEVITAMKKIEAMLVDAGALEYTDANSPPKWHPHVYPSHDF